MTGDKLRSAAGWVKRTWSANAWWLALVLLPVAVYLAIVAVVQTLKLDGRHLEQWQWGNAAECFAAVGTVGTLLWAVINGLQLANQARDDRRIADENRAAETEEKRLDQARRISGWTVRRILLGDAERARCPHAQRVYLSNSSSEPVYGVVFWLVWVQGGGAPRDGLAMAAQKGSESRMRGMVQVLPPGDFQVFLDGPLQTPMQGVLGVEMAFTDSAGRHWVRLVPSGNLESLDVSPVEHYGVRRPYPPYNQLQPMNA